MPLAANWNRPLLVVLMVCVTILAHKGISAMVEITKAKLRR